MTISYTTSLDGITEDHLSGGFFVGWPNPPAPNAHLRILQGSSHVVLAQDTPGGQVIGYITAISDRVSIAFIPHLEVLPAYQGQGIGSELVRRMLAEIGPIYAIDLMADEDVQPFYERLGFRQAGGMVRRDYARQSCA